MSDCLHTESIEQGRHVALVPLAWRDPAALGVLLDNRQHGPHRRSKNRDPTLQLLAGRARWGGDESRGWSLEGKQWNRVQGNRGNEGDTQPQGW